MGNGTRFTLLIAALATSAAVAQTAPEQVPVRRPDGTIIYPATVGGTDGGKEQGTAIRPDGSIVRPNAAGASRVAPDPVPVRRPDGTVVHPVPPSGRAPAVSAGDSMNRAEERERIRQEAQGAAERRIEQSRREREAAGTLPGRQVAPTSGQ
jgi:hypothetical protein